ncbi:hypothetical protein [Desulfosoma caldarium]|uniref:Uncharacterized protein n=1 Tax=Desulfosoma caldarium TaxID=610254 RepID=A0A3N1VJK1_9BACT|nr:hypothetical protein [Desulfosoma caldarium]ROR02983.1 hypothetical protein EDC27_0238 [Desulfosoma caldarium]
MMQMDRAVFDLGMSVHAVSLYILICALADEGRDSTLEAVRGQWTASEDALWTAAKELERHKVLRIEMESESSGRFWVQPSHEWI